MENKLKYLVPTAAVTSLFLIGCGDDDVSTADDSCPGTTGTEALLGGSWKMTKEDGVSTQGSEFEDEYGDKYTYKVFLLRGGKYCRLVLNDFWGVKKIKTFQ